MTATYRETQRCSLLAAVGVMFMGIFATLGCGSSSSASGTTGGTSGSCPTPLCSGTCCASGDSCVSDACCPAAQACGATCCASGAECVHDAAGNQACGVICEKSADCSGATPCCEPVDSGDGGFAGNGVCAAAPTSANPYACLCLSTAECGSGECVPDINAQGAISGPYVCALNDGASHDGCSGALTVCSVTNQFCSTDKSGDEFCSIACTSDALCGNPGVACCDATCAQGACCGLCGS
jgi:hypothetical protein